MTTVDQLPYQFIVICKRCGLKGEGDHDPKVPLTFDPNHGTIRIVIWVPLKCPRCGAPRE